MIYEAWRLLGSLLPFSFVFPCVPSYATDVDYFARRSGEADRPTWNKGIVDVTLFLHVDALCEFVNSSGN